MALEIKFETYTLYILKSVPKAQMKAPKIASTFFISQSYIIKYVPFKADINPPVPFVFILSKVHLLNSA